MNIEILVNKYAFKAAMFVNYHWNVYINCITWYIYYLFVWVIIYMVWYILFFLNSDQESCSDNNAGCTHVCIQGPFGAQCSCPVGYQLSNDSKTCEDVDECFSPGLCSQHCFNERGSFRCHCQEGYALEANQRTCKVSGEEECGVNLLHVDHVAANNDL